MWIDFLNIKKYKVQQIDYVEPIGLFEEFANEYGSVLLTGNGDESNSMYSFIAQFPNFEFIYDRNSISINNENMKCDVWEILHEILDSTQFHILDFPVNLCGLVGYATYELGRDIETLPKTTIDSYKMPTIQLFAYKTYYIFNNIQKVAWKIEFQYEKNTDNCKTRKQTKHLQIKNLSEESTKTEYLEKVKKIQNYIIQGDAYEVNLTQQISGDFTGDGFDFFKKLYDINDAPYSCFMNLNNLQIVSNSPELFLRATGKRIETRPIKGTVSRSDDYKLDLQNKQKLLDSEKDQAELFMIIDLLRNDLGKVSEIGSIKVMDPKKLEPFKNVYHLVGIVESILDEKYDYIDLIKATFPGGSITGCPKIRSMEIIDELETFSRNLYTGSIFIMNQNYLNSSIVIRTAVIKNDKIFINSGGAITIDSEPVDEYLEMQTKIKNIMELFQK